MGEPMLRAIGYAYSREAAKQLGQLSAAIVVLLPVFGCGENGGAVGDDGRSRGDSESADFARRAKVPRKN